MKIAPGGIAGVDLICSGDEPFAAAVQQLYGRAADALLLPALPYSVVAVNRTPRAIALLGIRFDMLNPQAKPYSVVHFADTLRHPERAALPPGAMRFVCAEPLYTDLVLRRGDDIHARGPMNLQALRRALQIRASVDCVAWADGEFAGPDLLGAFERFRIERAAELAFVEELLAAGDGAGAVIRRAIDSAPALTRDRALLARKFLAKRLHEVLAAAGIEALEEAARAHRPRMQLRRPVPE